MMCGILELLELGDDVFIVGFLEFLQLGDTVFSFGFFAIVKCCCVLWNSYCLKRI